MKLASIKHITEHFYRSWVQISYLSIRTDLGHISGTQLKVIDPSCGIHANEGKMRTDVKPNKLHLKSASFMVWIDPKTCLYSQQAGSLSHTSCCHIVGHQPSHTASLSLRSLCHWMSHQASLPLRPFECRVHGLFCWPPSRRVKEYGWFSKSGDETSSRKCYLL